MGVLSSSFHSLTSFHQYIHSLILPVLLYINTPIHRGRSINPPKAGLLLTKGSCCWVWTETAVDVKYIINMDDTDMT